MRPAEHLLSGNSEGRVMISSHRLREVVHYDHQTGQFTWIKTLSARAVAGKPAGTINQRGYLVITIDRKRLFAHRLAWLYHYGSRPSGVIDHIDGDLLNNAISNLRDVEQSQNTKNNKVSKNNTSGYPGVYLDKKSGSWYSQIWSDWKCLSLGSYRTKEEAIAARKSAEAKLGYSTRA